jgi:hypothetical protein
MLHNGKSHIGIRDYAPDRGEWEGKQVVICPLPMRQEINDAMSKHSDCLRLTPLRPFLSSLRATTSAQPSLPFIAKVWHLRDTKQRKPAQWRVTYDLR